MQVEVRGSWSDVDASAWDALVGDGSPFLEHTFLAGLETLGCAAPETGWGPRPVLVRDGDGTLVGGAPAWVKGHSMGEFVYDHGWANAARQAGIPYYPKLIVGVPFTPVTGSRLLVGGANPDPESVRRGLVAGLQAAAKDCHGLHVLFDTEAESAWLSEVGCFQRLQFQFHWLNEGYQTFDDFLARFTSKKRNKIRRERRDLRGLRIERVHAPSAAELSAMHGFYANTCEGFGPWGRVYLSPDLFQYLGDVWGDRLQLVLAYDGDRPVAGAFNVRKGVRLYGRYWGCADEVKFLHFEVCYYQAIEACIEQGLAVFEPGHGGGHKYRRGFVPTLTYSNHWLSDPRLHGGLERHATAEAEHVRREAKALTDQSPLR